MVHAISALIVVGAFVVQGGKPAVKPGLGTIDRAHFRLILPEKGLNGSAVDDWHLGHLVTVSMRESYVTLLDDRSAEAIEGMMTSLRQLRPDRPVRSLPILEVKVTTKRQGPFVAFAVWLRVFGDGLNAVSYHEQNIAPLAEEGMSVHTALGKLLAKLSADMASSRRTP